MKVDIYKMLNIHSRYSKTTEMDLFDPFLCIFLGKWDLIS
jgi:hypothetical protein